MIESFFNYEQRKVKRSEYKDYILSTCYSLYSDKYETALSHKDLKLDWIIIDLYDTMVEAEEGHEFWLKDIDNNGVEKWKS